MLLDQSEKLCTNYIFPPVNPVVLKNLPDDLAFATDLAVVRRFEFFLGKSCGTKWKSQLGRRQPSCLLL